MPKLLPLPSKCESAAMLIDRAHSKPGIAVWQNNGVPAEQAINHVHFHVAARWKVAEPNSGQ
jgi:histidine triad (HIT) family protein